MKTSTVFCFLMVVFCGQYVSALTKRGYSLSDFENHLAMSEETFVEQAPSNTGMALQVAVQNLGQAMGIAADLFNNGKKITAKKASEDIMRTFRNGFSQTLGVPGIKAWVERTCDNGEFPFPPAIVNEPQYTRFRIRMNRKEPT